MSTWKMVRITGEPPLVDLISLVQPETGESRVIAGFTPDGEFVGPRVPSPSTEDGPAAFSESDRFVVLPVNDPLPSSAKYRLEFIFALDRLSEVSLFDR